MDSNIIYYLYLKTHNLTGFKYLGITKQDPYVYKGSGIIWKNHIKKYGNDVKTEILGKYSNKSDLKQAGIEYSKKFNIVESKSFANLTIEEGQGGDTWNKKGRIISDETKRKMSNSHKGLIKSSDHQEKIRNHLIKYNKRNRTTEEKIKLSESQKKTRCKCPHCNFESTLSHVKRHIKKTHTIENVNG